MNFIEAYKKLEKQCNLRYNKNHGISIYIQEMINHPDGSNFIPSWNNDLKNLKRCRYIRNKIVHEPDCNERNMSTSQDIKFLNNFYEKLSNKNDPLSIYFKERKTNNISLILIFLIIIMLLLVFIFLFIMSF